MAALLAGQRVAEIAGEHNVPRRTISNWKRTLQKSGAFEMAESGPEKRIANLIGEYLIKALETLCAQAEYFKDPAFLRGQAASEAAVLHGVMFDKAIRILEAAQQATESEEAPDNVVPISRASDAGTTK